MPPPKDLPCADCSRLMHRVAGSLPEGQARCRSCRRRARPSIPAGKAMRCAGCGESMWRGATSKPEGEAYCRPCRREKSQAYKLRAAIECPTCRQMFRPRLSSSKFCSRDCSNNRNPDAEPTSKSHRGRALRYGVAYEPVDRLAVFERDGWLCQLCQAPIPRDVVWPHPLSASLDHVIPLSRGGPHTYVNVWSAHLRCNIQKGANLQGVA